MSVTIGFLRGGRHREVRLRPLRLGVLSDPMRPGYLAMRMPSGLRRNILILLSIPHGPWLRAMQKLNFDNSVKKIDNLDRNPCAVIALFHSIAQILTKRRADRRRKRDRQLLPCTDHQAILGILAVDHRGPIGRIHLPVQAALPTSPLHLEAMSPPARGRAAEIQPPKAFVAGRADDLPVEEVARTATPPFP